MCGVFCSCVLDFFSQPTHRHVEKSIRTDSLQIAVYTFIDPTLCSRVCTSQTKTEVQDDSLDHNTPFHYIGDQYVLTSGFASFTGLGYKKLSNVRAMKL